MLAKKRKIKKRKASKSNLSLILATGFFLLVAGFLVYSNLRLYYKRSEMGLEIESLKKEAQTLEERREQMQAGILEAETEAYWEARLYEQGYIRPGEEPIVIIPPEEIIKEEEDVLEEKGFLEGLLDWALRKE